MWVRTSSRRAAREPSQLSHRSPPDPLPETGMLRDAARWVANLRLRWGRYSLRTVTSQLVVLAYVMGGCHTTPRTDAHADAPPTYECCVPGSATRSDAHDPGGAMTISNSPDAPSVKLSVGDGPVFATTGHSG